LKIILKSLSSIAVIFFTTIAYAQHSRYLGETPNFEILAICDTRNLQDMRYFICYSDWRGNGVRDVKVYLKGINKEAGNNYQYIYKINCREGTFAIDFDTNFQKPGKFRTDAIVLKEGCRM
jgi:hypothetical protein